MRRLIVLFLAVLQISIWAQDGWQEISSDAYDYYSVCFLDSLKGFAGQYQRIKMTTDGGYTWTVTYYTSDYFVKINSIRFLTENIGIAVGSNGLILRTTNGGLNWVRRDSLTSLPLKEITTNGKNFIFAVAGPEENTYVQNIVRSTDMGDTWTIQQVPIICLGTISFRDSLNGWGVGKYGGIIKTSDGGQTWNWNSPILGGRYLYAICFLDSLKGIILGDGGYSTVVFRTTNAGNTWEEAGLLRYGSSIFTYDNYVWIYGGSAISFSPEGGINWQTQYLPLPFTSIYFYSPLRGVAVGRQIVYKTETAGEPGIPAAPPAPQLTAPENNQTTNTRRPIFRWTALEQYNIKRYRCQIARDSNFTQMVSQDYYPSNWAQLSFPIESNTNYFWRVKAENTWGASSYSETFRFRTCDFSDSISFNLKKGNTWYYKVKNSTTPDNPVKYTKKIIDSLGDGQWKVEVKKYYASGLGNVTDEYWRYTDGNLQIPQDGVGIFWADLIQDSSWCTGLYETYYYQVCYQAVFGVWGRTIIHSHFTANEEIRTANRIGIYYERNHTFSAELCLSGFLADGVIIGDTNGVLPASITEPQKSLSFKLYQNYPNPFNPETAIKFSVEKQGRATLTLFNGIGQTERIMFDGDCSPGDHTIMLNGSNLASGVYYYELKTAEAVQRKKMILLK